MSNTPPPPKKPSSSGMVVPVVVAVALLALVAGGIFVALKFLPTPPTTPASPPATRTPPTPPRVVPPTKPAPEPAVVKQLDRIGDAVKKYAINHNRLAPNNIYGKDGKAALSWRVAILPELGFEELYRQFRTDEPWDSDHNKKLLGQMPAVYALAGPPAATPSQTYVQGLTSQPGAKARTLFARGDVAGIELSVPDGTDNTLFAFAAAKPVEWTKPEDVEYDPSRLPTFPAYFDGKVAVLLTNCRSRLVPPDLFKPEVIQGMATVNGDEKFELP